MGAGPGEGLLQEQAIGNSKKVESDFVVFRLLFQGRTGESFISTN